MKTLRRFVDLSVRARRVLERTLAAEQETR